MTPASPDLPHWWDGAPFLQRVVTDLLAAEMASIRPGQRLPALTWSAALDLRPDLSPDLRLDLGADSLDLMRLASALETLLQLRPASGEQAGMPPAPPLLVHTRLDDWLAAARCGLDRDGSALTFRTSGSSGAPKACTHSLALLWQEAGALAALFGGRRRIVSLVPAHHIYGFLLTVLLPHALAPAAAPLPVCDLRGQAPGALAARLQPGDLVIGYPELWGALGESGASLAPDVVGVTSTAPCAPAVAQAALGTGLARLVQVYGSSETAGVGWRDDPDGDYQLLPYWRPGAQPERLERQRPDGTWASTALQDRLVWCAARRFRVDGRLDQALQVGGVNVFPAYVADVLKQHPAVLEASVRAMRPDEGQRLKAFVVAREPAGGDLAALRAELRAWVGARLSAPECPAAFSFGPALPRGASGKLADWIIDTHA